MDNTKEVIENEKVISDYRLEHMYQNVLEIQIDVNKIKDMILKINKSYDNTIGTIDNYLEEQRILRGDNNGEK